MTSCQEDPRRAPIVGDFYNGGVVTCRILPYSFVSYIRIHNSAIWTSGKPKIWESHVEPHKFISVENVKRKHMKSPVRLHEKCLRFSLVFNLSKMAFSSY